MPRDRTSLFPYHQSVTTTPSIMAVDIDQVLRKQISEAFRRSSEDIDREVAQALATSGEFRHSFNSQQLAVVFANILHTLVDLQKFAGVSVPLIHNVASIEVETRYPRISASAVLHIHSPIKAFIIIDYALINDPHNIGNLTLARRSLCVEEKTSRFDLVAKAALNAINIEGLVERELKDVSHIIRQTLPHRLSSYGFSGQIGKVQLEFTPDNLLNCVIQARSDGRGRGE